MKKRYVQRTPPDQCFQEFQPTLHILSKGTQFVSSAGRGPWRSSRTSLTYRPEPGEPGLVELVFTPAPSPRLLLQCGKLQVQMGKTCLDLPQGQKLICELTIQCFEFPTHSWDLQIIENGHVEWGTPMVFGAPILQELTQR